MDKKSIAKNYRFLAILIGAMTAGAVTGWFAPDFGHKIAFLGTMFINMMFCVVVPMVFCSISSAVANMSSAKKAGKVMGVTVGTFFVTATIAAVIMYLIARFIPLVSGEFLQLILPE